MNCIDTHCHYNLEPLAEDYRSHWQRAQEQGVTRSVVVGTNPQTSQNAVNLAAAEPAFFASVGIHPGEYQENPDRSLTADMDALRSLITLPKVVAVGETGLDYFRLPDDPELVERIHTAQVAAFRAQIVLARQHNLPLIIHVRDTAQATASQHNAYLDVLSLLQSEWLSGKPFILHCVSGPLAYIEAAVQLGAYIGVAANVTYPKSEGIREAIRMAPVDRVLSETDAPFLPPQGFRGQTCEPWMINKTVQYLQDELHISPQQLLENAQTLFPQLNS